MAHVFLSHILSEETPGFAGEQGFFNKKVKDISKGDSCNTSRWSLSNHIGTHVDSPKHFFDRGTAIDEYEADFWVFNEVSLVDLSVGRGELISPEDLDGKILQGTDLLLLRTGFEKFRNERVYWEFNPGLMSEVVDKIKLQAPQVRAVGFDFLSLTSFQHRAVGRRAHKSFLDEKKNQGAVLIFEDLSLQNLYLSPKRVIALPLRIKGADGSPATIIAEV